MQTEKPEKRELVREYFKYLKSMWWMLPPVLASIFAYPLQKYLHIPQVATYVLGYGILVIVIALNARKVWQQADAEKREMQKRFDAEDAALFGDATRH
jgi:hypothetical protein